ncbi:hypothetical protein FGIG_09564 [Fasciola gigantica]|uniref:Uncharacterized protein n=1 Tax=Fasciola gigantica TaxID=46835 RepID=A0A504YZM4_FASGI|nr:hypothetical protein FGIG_09564 [Fasciola gigantica]
MLTTFIVIPLSYTPPFAQELTGLRLRHKIVITIIFVRSICDKLPASSHPLFACLRRVGLCTEYCISIAYSVWIALRPILFGSIRNRIHIYANHIVHVDFHDSSSSLQILRLTALIVCCCSHVH